MNGAPADAPPRPPGGGRPPTRGRRAALTRGLGRVLVRAEERFIVPVQRSPRAPAWAAAHAALALPFTLRGGGRRWFGHVGTADGEAGDAGGEVVPVVCIGREKRFAPILDRLFERLEPAGSLPPRGSAGPGRFARTPAALLLVEAHRWTAPRFARAGWLIIPDAVRWRGELGSVPPPATTNSLRADLRKIPKHGYTIEPANAPEDWREFYEEMVLPSARVRFGDAAWIPSAGLRRAIASAGTVLFVRRDGRRVAAAAAIARGDTLWVPLIGVRGGDAGLIREGAGSAACAFSVDWARERGFRAIDWGRSSPFVHDGVQRFNVKWGLSPVPDPITHLTAARVDPRSAALRRAFAREPVLVQRGRDIRVYAG